MMRFGTEWLRVALWLLRVTVGLTHEVRGRENLPAGPALDRDEASIGLGHIRGADPLSDSPRW